jgi:hypothetical protein
LAIPGNFLSSTTERVDPNTSGWAAALNCSIGLGSGGRNGDGCLKLTSSAAGEMRAQTASFSQVKAGEVYWAFADASSATVPVRIGIEWRSLDNVLLGTTWSVTTSAPSASWHRISVAGQAPGSARYARVIFSAVTPATAGVISYVENVYFGYPLRFALNLLSFNAEQGGELDSTAWGVESNCTLSRTCPPTSWPVDWYYAGGEMLTLTVTAAGNASALCVERPAVTPGAEYLGYAYLSPPTSGAATWVELRFYDTAGNQVQATRSQLAAPGTGVYRQISSAVAPSNAVSASLAVGITGASAGQIVRSEGAVVKKRTAGVTTSITSDNVVLYGDAHFEQGVGQWTVPTGVAMIARSTPWGGQAYLDFYSLTVTSSTATASTIRSGRYPVTGGQNWRISVAGKRVAGGWTLNPSIRWYDASSTLISTSTTSAAALPSDGNWWVVYQDYTSPAGAVSAQVDWTLTATAASSTLQLDQVYLRQVLPATELTADDPSASTTLVLRELSTSTTMTLYRVLSDGSKTLVRGRSGLIDGEPIVSDSYTVQDYEAPLGVPVFYRAEFYSTPTGLLTSYRTTSPVTLDPGDRNYVWLKDPYRPQLNMRVLVKSAPDWQQPIDQTVHRVRGRQNAVVLSGVRSGREGDLVVWTQSDGERDALRYLLASGGVLLWQSAPGMGESDVYVSVANSAAPRVSPYAPEAWREWTLPLTEVDRPTGGIAGSATWTVQDVAIESDTVLTMMSRYDTVLDLALGQRTS